MKRNSNPLKWRHFEPSLILLCVGWYCRYQLSYRGLKEIMRERGLAMDHSTVWRWVQRYAPEINKRIRQHLKMSSTSYRVDETYIKVGKQCKYLYRAVDKEGNTIEFMLSAKRDVTAAKRFFKTMMRADHRFIKKKVRAAQCFKRFNTAERTLEGIEAVNMIRKGQVKRLAGSDAQGQAKFVGSLFGIAA